MIYSKVGVSLSENQKHTLENAYANKKPVTIRVDNLSLQGSGE